MGPGFSCEFQVCFLLTGRGPHRQRHFTLFSPREPAEWMLNSHLPGQCELSRAHETKGQPSRASRTVEQLSTFILTQAACSQGFAYPSLKVSRTPCPEAAPLVSSLRKSANCHKGLWRMEGKRPCFSHLWQQLQAPSHALAPCSCLCMGWVGAYGRAQWSEQTPWGNKDMHWGWWLNCVSPCGGSSRPVIRSPTKKNFCMFLGFCSRICYGIPLTKTRGGCSLMGGPKLGTLDTAESQGQLEFIV